MRTMPSKWINYCVVAVVATALMFSTVEFLPRRAFAQTAGDRGLAAVRLSDAASEDAQGNLVRLTPAEHLRRAAIYMTNRAFAEARRHWQTLIKNNPEDARAPEAMLGIGRSYFLAKEYEKAYDVFEELAKKYGAIKEGREGLNYSAASLLRMGRFQESATRYADYVTRFPSGERVETAHLNVIDTLREANRPQDALMWIATTKQRFAGSATETNAIFAELRLHIAESNWSSAVAAANQLSRRPFNKLVVTSANEVAYLRGFSYEHTGNKGQATAAYLSIPDGPESYYGWLASKRLKKLAQTSKENLVSQREDKVNSSIAAVADSYPAPYRQALVKASKTRKVDPRFLLAVMRQESVFKPQAKSPVGARGLLQFTIDTAQKYAHAAGLTTISESQLYQPDTSIVLGAEYVEQLSSMFPQQLEAVAASYNGGEDNVARWLTRAKHKDPGVFTAEIGFEETKGYVQKVMANYRVYTQLYTQDLMRR